MVNITQCLKGEVEAKYATGTVSLLDMHNIKTIIFFHILNVIIVIIVYIGIGKSWMTPEAVLTKLSYLIARNELTPTERKLICCYPYDILYDMHL